MDPKSSSSGDKSFRVPKGDPVLLELISYQPHNHPRHSTSGTSRIVFSLAALECGPLALGACAPFRPVVRVSVCLVQIRHKLLRRAELPLRRAETEEMPVPVPPPAPMLLERVAHDPPRGPLRGPDQAAGRGRVPRRLQQGVGAAQLQPAGAGALARRANEALVVDEEAQRVAQVGRNLRE